MKKGLLLLVSLFFVVSGFALTITTGKVYTIESNNNSGKYMQDNGDGYIIPASLNANSYWTFEQADNDGCYYVKNWTTGLYMQTTSEYEVSVKTGTEKVEIYIKNDPAKGEDVFGFASTDRDPHDFADDQTYGANYTASYVQGFSAALGARPNSFWKLAEVETVTGLTSPYEGVAPSAGDEFFLYNVSTGKWLGDNYTNTNGTWTSHAELGERGRDIALIASSTDGYFYLNPKLGNNHSINGSNLYMDTSADKTNWLFTPVIVDGVTNCYSLTTSGGYALGATSAGITTSDPSSVAENTNIWQLVTRDQRLAAMHEGDDCSWLVLGGTFPVADEHRSDGTWVGTTNGSSGFGSDNNGGDGTYHCNRVWEMWNITSKDVYQSISVPNGIYKVSAKAAYVSTGGSDMSSTHYDEWAADPEGNTKGVVYANGESTPMINTYAMTTDAQVENKVTKDLGNGKWVSNGTNQYSTRMFDGEFKTDDITVTVTDGTLKVGVKVEEGTGTSWILFDDFTVTYVGPIVDITPYVDGLNEAIANAEAFTGETTDALAEALATALADAKAKTSSTDTDELSEATANLNSALNAAKAVDVSELRLTVAYVKAKGASVSAQEEYLANGTTNEVDDQESAAVLALKQFMAETSPQPDVFTMISESVVGTDDNVAATYVTDHEDGFYVYNVGTGRWFCGGDDWGAHAAVGFPGIRITTPQDTYGTGNYNGVVTWLFNGDWGSGGKLSNSGYCDTGGNAWKFWQQDATQGIYTWSNNGDNTGDNTSNGYGTKSLVGFASSTYARVNVNQSGADDPYNQWIFVTEAQRDEMATAAMASASETNPVDLTYKIKMPGFNQRERKEGSNQSTDELDWTCNHANYRYDASDSSSRLLINGRGDNHADFVCDVYGAQWNDAFSLTQTISGLTPGKYRVKVQGYNNNGDDANKAYLLANGQKSTLVERSSEEALPWTTGLPENTFDNPEYFQVGLYWNEVVCTVGTDGELTLGVVSPSVTGSHVIIFDNFRLEYIGLEGVTIGDANYTTFVAPYDIEELPEGVEAYACQVQTSTVRLEQVEAIPEGEAVVLKNTGTYKFSPASGAVALGVDNDLLASDGTVQGGTSIYALANKTNGVGFYPVSSDITIPAGKGYLNIAGGGVKSFYGFEGDDPTAIGSIENGELNVESDGTVYNLAGQRISKMQQGVSIVGGRKVLY